MPALPLTHRFRACACPNSPHSEGDTVTYAQKLPFDAMARAIGVIYSRSVPTAQNAFDIYLHDGPTAWNLVDEDGQPVPLTDDALDALDFADQFEIADYADSLYRDTVISPLLRRTSESSNAGPTPASSRRPTKP